MLSRNLTQVGPQGTVASEWDLAGRRTKLTYPGSGLFVNYDYLVTGDMTKVRENGASSGIGVLATFAYDDLGRRTSTAFGNGTSTAYAYDAVSRLTSLTNNLTGTANDLTIGPMSYSPASQIVSQTRSNDSYAWTGHGSGSTASVANGLNQLTSIGGGATAHDTKGNLTTDPTTGKTYGYSSENLLTSASGGVTLGYDPWMRLYQVAGAATARFAYDGIDMIAEYNGSNALQRRFVHGPGMDEPLVQYEGTGTTDRRFMHSDERGSIVAISDASGNMLNINRYDDFGKPQATNAGRFQYTGQIWLGELGVYYYKARMYAPHLAGRFLQTDPIGGTNLYAYVGNDPINFVDPFGLYWVRTCVQTKHLGEICSYYWVEDDTIFVTGERARRNTSVESPGLGGTKSVGSAPGADKGDEGILRDNSDADEQAEACKTPEVAKVLSNPKVVAQTNQAIEQALNTPNLGLGADVPKHGSEVAFNVLQFGNIYTYVSGTYTNYREHFVVSKLSVLSPLASSVTLIHIHQSPYAAPGLSTADVNVAKALDINVVAVQPDGATFCAVGE